MAEYQNLGLFRRFYKDINSGKIFQYLADASMIQSRELVAICVGTNNQLSMVQGIAFKNFFVLATRNEVKRVLANVVQPSETVAQQINKAILN
ncbi:MAG TPA: hypothetical protein VNX68_19110 [Nitrosopumilaceae archaeon]|jgi:hypothetical protein|nr:hypothetical protein [Nitrosopumilaceae archaeon]